MDFVNDGTVNAWRQFSAHDCQVLCQRERKCEHFTFDRREQQCVLKTSAALRNRKTSSTPGVVSGPKRCGTTSHQGAVNHVAGPENTDCTTVCARQGSACVPYTVPESDAEVQQMFKEAGIYDGKGCTTIERRAESPPSGYPLRAWYRTVAQNAAEYGKCYYYPGSNFDCSAKWTNSDGNLCRCAGTSHCRSRLLVCLTPSSLSLSRTWATPPLSLPLSVFLPPGGGLGEKYGPFGPAAGVFSACWSPCGRPSCRGRGAETRGCGVCTL
jgi:hypothetical protein